MPKGAHKSGRGLNLLVRLGIGFGVIGVSALVMTYMIRTKPAPPLVDERSIGKIVRTIEVRSAPVARSWIAYGIARPLNEADVAYVEPLEPHQLRNETDRPFGFFCIVDHERDRPMRV